MVEDKRNLDPRSQLIANQATEHLAALIEKLPSNEQLVLTLYHYEDLTLLEIGAVLGLTEGRISQLNTKALMILRRRIERNSRSGAI